MSRPSTASASTVREGQTLGVVGESGSGKTTLGLAILRLIASEGPIVYLGRAIDGLASRAMRPLRKDMQVVFQDPYGSLSPRMSIADIVAEGLEAQGVSRTGAGARGRPSRARLTDVGLDPAAMDRYPHEFSGGQRQRIADRPGHGAGAEIRRPRRADLGARHVGAGADRRSFARSAGAGAGLPISSSRMTSRSSVRLPMRWSSCARARSSSRDPAADIFERPQQDYTRALLAAALSLETAREGVVSQ